MADEVAELTVRDLGDDRAARAAQQAATGPLCGITRLGRSVVIHLVGCSQRPDAVAVPGQLKVTLYGTVALRVRAAVNRFILLDSDSTATLPHPSRAVWVHETVEEFQAVDRSVDESQELLLARWGSRRSPPTTADGRNRVAHPEPESGAGVVRCRRRGSVRGALRGRGHHRVAPRRVARASLARC